MALLGKFGDSHMQYLYILILSFISFFPLTARAQVSADFGDPGGDGAVVIGESTTTCDSSIEGALRYNSSITSIEFCDGTSWSIAAGGQCEGPAICPNVGDVCDDSNGGTTNDPIFAGCASYGGTYEALFVTDDNQSTASQWKTSIGTDDIATDSFADGQVNDSQIANSTTFPAFKLCKDLTDGGFTDWYLPARNEMDVLWQNHTEIDTNAAGNFTTSAYWTSTEINSSAALDYNFSVGDVSGRAKNTDYDVRCVRRD